VIGFAGRVGTRSAQVGRSLLPSLLTEHLTESEPGVLQDPATSRPASCRIFPRNPCRLSETGYWRALMGFRGSRVQIPPSRLGNQMPDNRLGRLAFSLGWEVTELLTELWPSTITGRWKHVPEAMHHADLIPRRAIVRDPHDHGITTQDRTGYHPTHPCFVADNVDTVDGNVNGPSAHPCILPLSVHLRVVSQGGPPLERPRRGKRFP
jgi:hypothetical protein